VYVVFGTPYGPDKGFYVSNDGGDFACGGRPGASGGYQWWFGRVWVDDANECGTISAIAPAKTAAATIFVGTDTGRVWKTTDLGGHWAQLQGLPARWVNGIVVDPTDADHVFAAFSGYREGDDAANVWESTDAAGARRGRLIHQR
jgi:hypothetical protein